MKIKLGTQELTAKGVHGRAEMYQGAVRDGLEFIFDKDAAPPVEELDALFAAAGEITLTDDSGESFVHSGYALRGPMRVYPAGDGWEVAVKQFRKTGTEAVVESAGAVVAGLAAMQVAATNGEAGAMRDLAGTLALVADLLPARAWEVGMTTQPGEIVWDPAHKYAYVFTGTAEMTHANQTFYPGAAGVYHWAIIPEVHEGVKVYPDIAGIIVAVKRDEIWWNAEKDAKYRWNDADNRACSWHPGQAGAHQWVAV